MWESELTRELSVFGSGLIETQKESLKRLRYFGWAAQPYSESIDQRPSLMSPPSSGSAEAGSAIGRNVKIASTANIKTRIIAVGASQFIANSLQNSLVCTVDGAVNC
jgi:hypothetical protein